MKKALIRLMTVLLMFTLVLPFAAVSETRADSVPTEEQAYRRMIALKDEYPEGMPWTNANFYAWHGGGNYYAGYGCVAFAYILSDAAFGSLPSRYISDIQIENIHVGDILRINNNTHSVIVLQVNGTESVTIAEGNFNSSIHWGRTLTAEQIEDSSTTELQTRYPEGTAFESDLVGVEGLSLNRAKKTLTRTSSRLAPSFALKPKFTPSNASNQKVSWKSSNRKVAKVSSTGIVTAVGPGTATIICTSKDNSAVKANCIVTVKDTLVKKITLNYKKKSLSAGKTLQLKARISPSSAVNPNVKWISGDKKIAKVSAGGKVTAVKTGTCIIRCVAKDSSEVIAECRIIVK